MIVWQGFIHTGFWVSPLGSAIIGLLAGIILFWGIKKIAGLRVDKRIEEEGLDIYEHGESCYN
jgi:ammonia channel protein AmtB